MGRKRKKRGSVHGALVVDKAPGKTSHDVVARLRRVFGTRQVGHAGTLDPAATGVLVVLFGDATRLVPYLTAQEKSYRAHIAFGRETSTDDQEGETVLERPLPPWLAPPPAVLPQPLEAAFEALLAQETQVPPAVSAIRVDGKRAHELVRRGEVPQLAPRPVRLLSLRDAQLVELEEETALGCELKVEKGYYIRSFARDLGRELGSAAHLLRLRRLSSGPFELREATGSDESDEALREAFVPIGAFLRRCLPGAELKESGARKVCYGQRLSPGDFETPPPQELAAWFWQDRPWAIGAQSGSGPKDVYPAAEQFAKHTGEEGDGSPGAWVIRRAFPEAADEFKGPGKSHRPPPPEETKDEPTLKSPN